MLNLLSAAITVILLIEGVPYDIILIPAGLTLGFVFYDYIKDRKSGK